MLFIGNALAHPTQRYMLSPAIGTVFVQDSAQAGRAVADRGRSTARRGPNLGALIDKAEVDVLAFITPLDRSGRTFT